MKNIPIGARGSYTMKVNPSHLASQFKDSMLPPVFSTPVMIAAMENAALNAVKPYLDKGESCVGTAVDIQHLAATPVGQTVTAEAVVVKAEGRRIWFDVTARDEVEEIGRGKHERMTVDVSRVADKLKLKQR